MTVFRLLLALGVGLFEHGAHANLQVYPTRIQLSDSVRTAHVSMRHVGTKPGHYKVTPVFYRMTSAGSLELTDKPGPTERSLAPMLRFSPRKTTIPPNQEQVVRVMYSGPKDLPEGEY